MADYSQPDAMNKRVRFFDGQFLQDQDFIDEQKFHLDRERRISRLLGFSGVAEGLVVTVGGGSQLTVGNGSAVDALGRQLVLAAPVTLILPVEQFRNQVGIEIQLLYRESPTDDSPADVGGQGARRWDETPAVAALARNGSVVMSPDGTDTALEFPVVLTTVQMDDDGIVGVNPGTGTRAGLEIPGAVGIGTAHPTAKLQVTGGGGQSVDLVVNGRLRSDSDDGGLWIAQDRFVGGLETTKVGLFNQTWGLTLTADGHVGVGTTTPENAAGWDRVLDVHGQTSSRLSVSTGDISGCVFSDENSALGALPGMVVGTETDHPLSFATNGVNRMHIAENGGVHIGPIVPMDTLDFPPQVNILAPTHHLQLSRSIDNALRPMVDAGTNRQVFLELFQDDIPGNSVPEVWPSIRFHHHFRFWHRLEAESTGFHMKTGKMDEDGHSDLWVKDLHADDLYTAGAIYLRPRAEDGSVVDDTEQHYWYVVTPSNPSSSVSGPLHAHWSSQLLFPSDLRLKREITQLTGAVGKLSRLNGVSFDWNEQGLEYLTTEIESTISAGPHATAEENQAVWDQVRRERSTALDRRNIGLIAQEVEEVLPELVSTDSSGLKSVDYAKMTAVLVQAIKEQQQAIDQLRALLADRAPDLRPAPRSEP